MGVTFVVRDGEVVIVEEDVPKVVNTQSEVERAVTFQAVEVQDVGVGVRDKVEIEVVLGWYRH